MELTVDVRHGANGHYAAEILGPEPSGLAGVISETRALIDLGELLEDRIRLVLGDPDLELAGCPLRLGTQLVSVSSGT